MKKSAICLVGIFLVLCTPMSSYAISNFSIGSGVLVIPRVYVDGDLYYDNVSLKLDFNTGAFELLNATATVPPEPDEIIETQDVEDFSLSFQGCFRTGRDEVRCYMKITNNDFDRDLFVNLSSNETYPGYAPNSKLYDDLNHEYIASKITIANKENNIGDWPPSDSVVRMIRGIPAFAVFKFNGISPSASSLSLFKPGFISEDIRFQGDFRSFGDSFF
jgi:hypothetical protein